MNQGGSSGIFEDNTVNRGGSNGTIEDKRPIQLKYGSWS